MIARISWLGLVWLNHFSIQLREEVDVLSKLKTDEIIEAIDYYRGLIMDIVEQELADQPNWQFVRGRLLKAMGHRGLERRIREILGVQPTNQDGNQ